MGIGEYIVFGWIAIVVVIWVVIRRRKPNLIGTGEDRSKQKLDGVKPTLCPKCNKGVLEPKFHWWRYFFGVMIPGHFYIFGRPNEYRCTNCNQIVKDPHKGNVMTRISLSQHLPIAFVIAQISIFAIGTFLIIELVLNSLDFDKLKCVQQTSNRG